MGREIVDMLMSKLTVSENSRADGNLAIDTMAQSILAMGIQQPLAVRKVGKDFEVLSGHRRLAGAIEAQRLDPKTFKTRHPRGIPVFVRDDIVTDEDAARVKVDHATQLSLTLRCELYKSVAILLKAGMTEESIAEHLEGLFAQLGRSMSSKVRDEIKTLRTVEPVDKKAVRKLLLATYKGQIQGLKKIYACPAIVAAALQFGETGEPVEGFKDLPSHVRAKHIEGLLKAFQADIAVGTDGTVAYSKADPGPAFKKAWANVVKDVPVNDGKARLKGVSSKALMTQLASGTYASQGMQKITSQHAGMKDIIGIDDADIMLHLCELMKKYRPAEWKAFEKAAIELKKAIGNGTA